MFIKYLQRALISLLLLFMFIQIAESNIRICGNKLTATIQAICRNEFCGGYKVDNAKPKKSIADVALAMEQGVDLNSSRRWHLANRSYGSFYKNSPKKKRMGLATQCCLKKCNLDYIKTFCCANRGYEKYERT